ncbi:unnamed protein product [Urochloa decumbens]|uniref:Uncharacterized protein n=1 Tax=Urochloa decumbens TaxID=240449 RepID=A0ABC9H5P8_9POAL
MAVVGGLCLLVAALAAAWISTASTTSLLSEKTGRSQKPINCMPCSRTYIGDAYTDAFTDHLAEHRGLVGMSDSGELCKGLTDDFEGLTLSELHRQLAGEGSHRRLVYSMKFGARQDAMFNFLDVYDAHLVIIEKLPNGVFVDPFELQHFVERKVFLDVAVFGDTNLELPSVLSNRSAVKIHFDLSLLMPVGTQQLSLVAQICS